VCASTIPPFPWKLFGGMDAHRECAVSASSRGRRVRMAAHTRTHRGSEFDLDASSVIVAVRQQPDFRGLEILSNGNGNGWIKTDDWGRTRLTESLPAAMLPDLAPPPLLLLKGGWQPRASTRVFQGRTLEKQPPLPAVTIEKLKLDWYPAAPRHEGQKVSVAERELSTEVERGLTEDEVLEEAKRCMSCGMCMDCETCWMYCSNNCFVRLPKGEHSKIKLEVCNGCKKCAEACPSGYIEMS